MCKPATSSPNDRITLSFLFATPNILMIDPGKYLFVRTHKSRGLPLPKCCARDAKNTSCLTWYEWYARAHDHDLCSKLARETILRQGRTVRYLGSVAFFAEVQMEMANDGEGGNGRGFGERGRRRESINDRRLLQEGTEAEEREIVLVELLAQRLL